MQTTMLHAALVASPGLGHVLPIIELGKRLVTHHGFGRVTIFVATTDVSLSKSRIEKTSQNPNLVFHFVLLDVLEEDQELRGGLLTKIVLMVREAMPKLKSAISSLEPRPRVLIVDWLGTESLAMAEEFEMTRKYVLVTTSAWFLALVVYMASLDKEVLYNHVTNEEPLLIPGCSPVQLEPVQDRSNEQDLFNCLRIGAEISTADGVLVNTWHDLEPVTLGSFMDLEKLGRVMNGVPVQPVGPLFMQVEPGLKHEALDWLDLQPKESVLYVSFGSGGTLTAEQTAELAWGLELSEQRFVWVIRAPIENDASAAMFYKTNEQSQPLDFLPDGFLARTHKTGLVVPMWAPQTEILAHPSIGGFLSHCGWNSALESIINGVPMIAWPLYAEHKLNGRMLSEELNIAVRSKMGPQSDGVVKRYEIEGMVRKLMEDEEGLEMRKRVKELKGPAEKALSEGGSSYNSLSNLAKIMSHV